jgi:hypothetical protein
VTITLEFTDAELRDLAAALSQRLSALADARPGWRSKLGHSVEATVQRVLDLQTRVVVARKELAYRTRQEP